MSNNSKTNMSELNCTNINESYILPNDTNCTNDDDNFSNVLYEVDTWLTVFLSIVSIISIIFFTFIYIHSQIKARDHVKDTKKSAFKKVIRNEYLVLSYCVALFFSHLFTIAQKISNKYFIDDMQDIQLCLAIGILKHFFWTTAIFHSNAVSVKVYMKLTKTNNNNFLDRKDWFKSAIKIFIYIYTSSFIILACSLSVNFTNLSLVVYELDINDKMNCCFLSYPNFLIIFFAFPIGVILCVNVGLFLTIFFKTKTTIHQSENNDMNYLFLKLFVIMGLTWIVYLVTAVLIEFLNKRSLIQIFTIIGEFQMSIQGLIVVLCLFSNAAYEKFFTKKKNHKGHPQQAQHNNNNNNINMNHHYHRRITVL